MLIIQITQVMKVPGHSSIIQNQSNARFGGKKNYPEKKKEHKMASKAWCQRRLLDMKDPTRRG